MEKILQVTGSLKIGGLEKTVVNYLKNLDESDYNFTFLVYGDNIGELGGIVEKYGGRIISIDKPSVNYLAFYKNIRKIIKKYGPFDIIHSHTLFISGLILKAAYKERIAKRYAHSHTDRSSVKQSLVKRVYIYYMRYLIKKYATGFLASSSLAGCYLYGTDFFNRNGFIVPNGIDTEEFKYDDIVRLTLREKFQFGDKLIIGTVGTLNYIKNHKILIHAMSFLVKVNPEIVLVIVGTGPLESELKELVKYYNLSSHVKFFGQQTNISSLLNCFDIFAFPSFFEGLGISLVEAQSIGLPCVVSSNLPDEVYINNNIVKISPKASGEEWAASILKAEKYSVEKKNNVNKNFDNKIMLKELLKAYNT